ncbi:MAG: serine/threonine-protein phosphatase [Bifidobacteriaceae bacterium]|nr:serine/threonine-protein phosphatase [Bifidobacteriaceae bacterium]
MISPARTANEPVSEPAAEPVAPTGWAVGVAQGQGAREYQQDRYAVWADPDSDELHLVVADGMGGAEHGEAIAEATVQAISGALSDLAQTQPEAAFSQVTTAIDEVSREVLARHRTQGGTTLIACRAWANNLWFASVGDSSLYLRRDERLFELNRRHEYRLDLWRRVLNGDLTLAESEADPQLEALASYIGCEELSIDATLTPLALQPGDTILACSDGVSDTLSQGELRSLLGLEPKLAADALARRVVAADLPHQDNYTAVVARYYPEPVDDAAAPTAPDVAPAHPGPAPTKPSAQEPPTDQEPHLTERTTP